MSGKGSTELSLDITLCLRHREGEHCMVYQERISINTTGHRDMHDVTGDVARIIERAGISTGMAHVFNVGSTGAIGAIGLVIASFVPILANEIPKLATAVLNWVSEFGIDTTAVQNQISGLQKYLTDLEPLFQDEVCK